MNLLDQFFGPLATIECQRASRPWWLAWVRMIAGLPAAGIALVVLWLWMLWSTLDPIFLPGNLLGYGLLSVEMTQIVLALLLGPALVAGSIAGEKDRGTLALLLSSRLTASDIVLGRLAGCCSQVALLGAAALPMIVLFAALREAGAVETLLLAGLPCAVALGAAGLSVATSTLARRGRDALLTTYVLEVVLIVAGFLGAASRQAWLEWLAPLNPFAALTPLVWAGALAPAAIALLPWLALCAGGTAIAIWQLRAAHYRQSGGSDVRGGRTRRRRLPPVGARPMLWKELYIESLSSRGFLGKWLSRLLTLALLAGGLVILAIKAWQFAQEKTDWDGLCFGAAITIGGSSTLLLWLIQWGIALRAAGSISGERQRSTWDAIMTSPLEAREIVLAKVAGSLYALRYLVAAALLAWTAAVLAEGMTIAQYANGLALLVAAGAFMAAVGVAVSTGIANATRGMAVTIGLWMAAAVASSVLAWLLAVMSVLLLGLLIVTLLLATGDPANSVSPNKYPWAWGAAYIVIRVGLYLAGTVGVVLWIAARFDAMAGRQGSPDLGEMALKSLKSLNEAPSNARGER